MERWNRIAGIGLAVVATLMVIFQATYSQRIFVDTKEFLIGHLGFAILVLSLTALTTLKSKVGVALQTLVMLAGIGILAYMFIFASELQFRSEYGATGLDVALGVLLVIVVLVLTGREYGWVLPGMAVVLLLYGFFGHLIPGAFACFYQEPEVLISKLTTSLGPSGMFGIILRVSALYIFLFMIFATFIQETKTTGFFEELSKLVSGKFRSGPALGSVVTSSLVGSVSGQAGANVIVTGSYTIPAMKTAGYTPEQAGGIESAASTAGPIIPPVMGVAAFIMSGITGIPYSKIILVAIIPALFYVISAGINVELSARKMGIHGLVGKANLRELFTKMPLFLVALLVIVFLFVEGWTPLVVGFWAMVTIIALGMIQKSTRLGWRNFISGFTRGAQIASGVAATCATLGIVVGTLTITGLAVKLPMIIGDTFGTNLTLLLIFAGVTSIILGTGLPASASYILVAIVLCPMLVKFGVALLPAHFFAFYFANFSYITPPVALAAVFAARLAGSSYIKTAVEAFKVGVAGFILPFMIIWVPGFMGDFSDPVVQVTKLIIVLALLFPVQMALVGHFLTKLGLLERVICGVSAATLILYIYNTNWMLMIFGLLALFAVLIGQLRKRGTEAQLQQAGR